MAICECGKEYDDQGFKTMCGQCYAKMKRQEEKSKGQTKLSADEQYKVKPIGTSESPAFFGMVSNQVCEFLIAKNIDPLDKNFDSEFFKRFDKVWLANKKKRSTLNVD